MLRSPICSFCEATSRPFTVTEAVKSYRAGSPQPFGIHRCGWSMTSGKQMRFFPGAKLTVCSKVFSTPLQE